MRECHPEAYKIYFTYYQGISQEIKNIAPEIGAMQYMSVMFI